VEINDSLGDRLGSIIDIAAYPRHLTTIRLIPKFSPRAVTAIVRFARDLSSWRVRSRAGLRSAKV